MKNLVILTLIIAVRGQLTLPPPLLPLPNIPGLLPPPRLPNLLNPQRFWESLPEPSLIPDIINITALQIPQKFLETFVNMTLPNMPGLPNPQTFLETILNITSEELNELISDFNFDDIPVKDVTFTLYMVNGTMILNSTNMDNIKTDEPMKFLSHGWGVEQDFVQSFTKSYHSIGINNVIGVDWSLHSKRSYLHAARSTKRVGDIVGDFIMNLVKNDTKLLKNIHLIGHSLGAHLFGFTGKFVNKITKGGMIGRITALDAAGPLFEVPLRMPENRRLTKTDAQFVDSIHTNVGFFGFLSPFADADFYVNHGGPMQPGCVNINMFESLVCSHSKSYIIYAKTITSKNYLATSCENPLRAIANFCNEKPKIVMGEHAKPIDKGEFLIRIDINEAPVEEIF